MHVMKCLMAMVIAAAGVVAFAAQTQAADPGYCRNYANAAVNQFREYRNIPGCFQGANDRWRPNWNAHYGWCLGVPWENARDETGARANQLRGCRMRAYGHP
jgi:hypothetical protein